MSDDRIEANKELIQDELAEFQQHYWPVYLNWGEPISFGEALTHYRLLCLERAVLSLENDDDGPADWEM